MPKPRFLPVLAVSAAAAAVLGGVPAVVIAATAGGASATSSPAFGPLSPTLAAELSQNVNQPVIVVLKDQFGAAAAGTSASSGCGLEPRESQSLSSRTHAWLRVQRSGAIASHHAAFGGVELHIERTIKKVFW